MSRPLIANWLDVGKIDLGLNLAEPWRRHEALRDSIGSQGFNILPATMNMTFPNAVDERNPLRTRGADDLSPQSVQIRGFRGSKVAVRQRSPCLVEILTFDMSTSESPESPSCKTSPSRNSPWVHGCEKTWPSGSATSSQTSNV